MGVTTTLVTFSNNYGFTSQFVGGPNGRFYSAIQKGGGDPGHMLSLTSAAHSQRVYAGQYPAPAFTQSLPDGTLLAMAITGSTWYLAKGNVDGTVTSFYPFPTNVRPLSAIYASDGNYYGIVATSASPVGYVFRVTPSGAGTSLYTFPPSSFGSWAPAPLLQGADGNLYGALPNGGVNHAGQIFKLTLSGQYTALYTFPAGNLNGGPTTLIQAGDGKLYGAAVNSSGQGYLFRVTTGGQYRLLYDMNPVTDGICSCNLIQGSDGIIYGVAPVGGSQAAGSVFALNVGLPKPKPRALQFTPQSGSVGTQVQIWGYNLLAPSVQFNGVAASTTTSSGPQYVLATVPTGATSGPITVTTLGGSYTTKSSFTVQ